MKLYGGRHGQKKSGKHAAEKRSSFFAAMPKAVRIALMILLALVILAGALVLFLKGISKPPERPNLSDSSTNQQQDQPQNREELEETEDPEEQWQPPTKVETEITTDDEGNEVEVMIQTEEPVSYKEGVYNILVCGTDGDGLRTDTIIIANLNANDHSVSLMSIPRDTLIYGNYAAPKINSSFAVGGVESLKTQLAKLLGFMVDGYVVVDLEAFIKIVDLVGGVEFDVPQNMYYNDPAQDLYINLQKGQQLLDGEHAMQLVRYRSYANADIARIGVQQDFLRALAKKCVSIGSLTKMQEYAEIVIEYVKTDLTLGNMVWFGEQLLQCDFEQMKTYTPSGEGTWVNGLSCYALYASSILRIVNESFNPYDTDLTISNIVVRSAPAPEPVEDEQEEDPSGDTQQDPTDDPQDSETSEPEDSSDSSELPPGYILPGTSGSGGLGNQDDWFGFGGTDDPITGTEDETVDALPNTDSTTDTTTDPGDVETPPQQP